MINRNKINTLLVTLAILSLGLPSSTKAADIAAYKLEQGIPFIGGAGQTLNYGEFSTLFQKFITAVYIIAAIAAFIKIFLAGIKWYTSGGSSKAISQAREDIKNALMGLAFLFLAGTLLVFINPNLNKLSKVFNPHGGTQCVKGGNSTNGGNTENGTGTLTSIKNHSGYYADSTLSQKLAASGLTFDLTTGCTNTDNTACNPNYCQPSGCEKWGTNSCSINNGPGSSCARLGPVSCHFNGTCVDLTPYDDNSIKKLRCAGLDVFYEPKDGSCGKSTGTHLHVSITSSGFIPENTTEKCWFPHQPSNSQYCQN